MRSLGTILASGKHAMSVSMEHEVVKELCETRRSVDRAAILMREVRDLTGEVRDLLGRILGAVADGTQAVRDGARDNREAAGKLAGAADELRSTLGSLSPLRPA